MITAKKLKSSFAFKAPKASVKLPPVCEKPAQEEKKTILTVLPSVEYRVGRTLDFDTARRNGIKVEGIKYMGKVYVTNVRKNIES